MLGLLKNLPEVPPADRTVAVLAVSPWQEDHARLRDIFSHSNWKIHEAHACREALRFLRKRRLGVVICDADLPDGSWKDLLEKLPKLTAPPLLVITSSHADDSLWAEVLNLGGYDLLAKPFDSGEVTRIISLAWLHWKESVSVRAHPKRATPAAASRAIA